MNCLVVVSREIASQSCGANSSRRQYSRELEQQVNDHPVSEGEKCEI